MDNPVAISAAACAVVMRPRRRALAIDVENVDELDSKSCQIAAVSALNSALVNVTVTN